jgi:hypothetical protein
VSKPTVSKKPADPAWNIRDPREVSGKAEATAAAYRAHITVAEWVGQAVREKIAREREPQEGEVIPPGQAVAPPNPTPPPAPERPWTPAEIVAYVEAYQAVMAARGKPVPKDGKILVAAERLLRMQLLMGPGAPGNGPGRARR